LVDAHAVGDLLLGEAAGAADLGEAVADVFGEHLAFAGLECFLVAGVAAMAGTTPSTTRRNGRAAAGAVPESPSAAVRLRDSAHRADRVGRDSAPALAGRVGRHPVTDRRSRRR
jgi:hypothetical protein